MFSSLPYLENWSMGKHRVVKDKDVLHQKVPQAETSQISKLFSQLLRNTINQRKGAVGFAGNQVRIPRHVFTALIGGKWRFYANAIRIGQSEKKEVEILEDCLSLPKESYLVKRFHWIAIEHELPNGNLQVDMYKEMDAIIIQHEMDHLNGILISDHGIRQGEN